MQQVTSITITAYEAITSILNVGLFILAIYMKLQMSKIQNQFQQEGRDSKDLILSTVNGKYVKTEVYNEKHANILEKLSEIHEKELALYNRYNELEQHQKSIDKKLILLSTVPCPFQADKQKFLTED